MPDISVVVTSYDFRDLVDGCLSSIIQGTKDRSYEIIVVDDASTDGTPDMIRKKYPSVKLLINPQNLGYVRSNNIGVRESLGKYVFSLNNDTVVAADAISKLAKFLDEHPDAGAVGPRLVNGDGSLQMQCRRSFPSPLNAIAYFSGLSALFPKNKLLGAYLLTYLDDSNPEEVDCLCGASMMVRREAIDEVGLMDEDYYMYGDDVDWCFRMKESRLEDILPSLCRDIAFWRDGWQQEAEFQEHF